MSEDSEGLVLTPGAAIEPTIKAMTHKGCVDAAYAWLSGKCEIVLPEFFTWNDELADVIGFRYNSSTVVECKVSRADYLKDKRKPFRVLPRNGMGDFRYYCCPKGLISPDELPDGWGLVYIYPSGYVKQVKKSGWHREKNLRAEHHLLFYYARRAQQAGVHNAILEQRMGT